MSVEPLSKQYDIEVRYQQDVAKGDLLADEAQAMAVAYLKDLAASLVAREERRANTSLFSEVLGKLGKPFKKSNEVVPAGLYFWGGVGRGKTYLMDLFFECLPVERKLRLHFHRFMQRIHNELTRLQGEQNPLVKIADDLSKSCSVICLDEFFVKDITDAMILAGLLEALFERGVVLVTTSNIEPSGLYKDGLQRARFLPAIALLEKHTQIVNVDGGVDYRLRTLEQAELFHSPLDDEAFSSLERSFVQLAPEQVHLEEVVEILGRPLQTVMCADDIVWFDFTTLCDGPRSQNDYIELAKLYHAVLLSNVPVMSEKTDDQARRFINLIDEFYDRNVKLIISAESDIQDLYGGGRLSFEFERTQSRLLEMQSHEYLAREHKP
jgi:cell division protein ZapE